MKTSQNFKLIGISILLALAAACDKTPGPAESAGKQIDQAANDTGKKISETADKVGEKISDQSAKAAVVIDQAANDAGKKISQTVDKVGEKMSDQSAKAAVVIEDSEITAKVKAAILAEEGLKTLQVSVVTVKGVVTLTGSVDSMAKSETAKSLAGAVAGVTAVKNNLEVKPIS